MGGILAISGGSIMTAGAGTRDPGMIKVHSGPVGGDVTVITHITGR